MLGPAAGLWLAVLLSGLYHGVNPGMGWPLAVSAALFEGRRAALWPALGMLTLGHLVAMLAILLPFAAMTMLLEHERAMRLGAGGVVMTMGLYLLATRRHPRFLSRVPPGRLALWSFLVAVAHGAALMLVPIYLGICGIALSEGSEALLLSSAGLALAVAVGHSAAMLLGGGTLAYAVHRWLGLQFLRRGWFDLELVWAASLVLVGGLGVWMAL